MIHSLSVIYNWLFGKKPQIYFLHIPKTGGTTLAKYLSSNFKSAYEYPYSDWHSLLTGNPKRLPSQNIYQLVHGHFGYGFKAKLRSEQQTITMMRNPAERTLSCLYHIKFDPSGNNWVAPGFIKPSENPLEVVRDKKRREVLSNIQAKHLALELRANEPSLDAKGRLYFEEWLYKNKKFGSEKKLLSSAVSNLESLDFVGLTEYFQESLLILADRFKWSLKIDNEKLQSVGNRPSLESLNSKDLASLKSINKVDEALYKKAKNIFFADYKALVKRRLGYTPSDKDLAENRLKISRDLIENISENGHV